jgi:hypothetical protein
MGTLVRIALMVVVSAGTAVADAPHGPSLEQASRCWVEIADETPRPHMIQPAPDPRARPAHDARAAIAIARRAITANAAALGIRDILRPVALSATVPDMGPNQWLVSGDIRLDDTPSARPRRYGWVHIDVGITADGQVRVVAAPGTLSPPITLCIPKLRPSAPAVRAAVIAAEHLDKRAPIELFPARVVRLPGSDVHHTVYAVVLVAHAGEDELFLDPDTAEVIDKHLAVWLE